MELFPERGELNGHKQAEQLLKRWILEDKLKIFTEL